MNRSKRAGYCAVVLPALLLAACGKSNSERATQVVAKVNDTEITVHELNAALMRLPDVTPDSVKAVSGKLLEQLIDQQLLLQKAQEAKLDRNPAVVQAIASARQAVLASAWLQQIAAEVPAPSDQDVKDYIVQHPQYFSGRRVFIYRSVLVQASPAQTQDIEQQLVSTKSIDGVLSYLRANNLSFVITPQTKSSEQLPTEQMARFGELKDGDLTAFATAGSVELVQLTSSRPEPVDEAQARPFVQEYLLKERQKQRTAKALQSLRAAAKIEYLGEFKASPLAVPKSELPANDATSGIASGIN
jgi:EpsD family peptidyl-prolyl cis-trans isomerase